ncbi:tRNA-queuosine alpha-mannosyltransferase-like [Branchiostoma lanceolatum]|uniref:tRNA-queuosine alpha-mannosyltransferase-like n=1 Tax=Branchiostoma lanceolatum TaxID=7740 RepID=UPI0034543C4A
MCDILLIEPFYGGSHKQLIDLLWAEIPGCVKVVLPAKKWHWRARTAALYISQQIPHQHNFRVLFASSVLNLAELLALRPDLTSLKKLLYFHENQLVYPIRKHQDRDFQYGYNQVLSCLVADVVLFNSQYNQDSFLSSIKAHFSVMPDCRPKGLADQIRPKCQVLYFPINFPARWRDCYRTDVKTDTMSSGHEVATGEQTGRTCAGQFSTMDDKGTTSILDYTDTSSLEQLSTADCAENSTDEDMRNDFVLAADRSDEEDALLSATASLSKTSNKSNNLKMLTAESSESGEKLKFSQHGMSIQGEMASSVGSCVKSDQDLSKEKGKPSSDQEKCRSDRSEPCDDQGSGFMMRSKDGPLHIVWPHRWEHDKNPDLFFHTLFQLKEEGCSFMVSVLGQEYTDVPEIFAEAAEKLEGQIHQWGHLAAKEDYYRLLHQADVVVSTADHEFYGVSMLESVYCGCYPLCPNRLVYPEIFPKECLYNTPQQLKKRLRDYCRRPQLARKHTINLEIHQYSWEGLAEEYRRLLQ